MKQIKLDLGTYRIGDNRRHDRASRRLDKSSRAQTTIGDVKVKHALTIYP